MVDPNDPVAIRRYRGSRLYCPGQARYVTLGDLAAMAEGEEAFVVHDARTGEDMTRSVLQEITNERGGHG